MLTEFTLHYYGVLLIIAVLESVCVFVRSQFKTFSYIAQECVSNHVATSGALENLGSQH